MRRVSVLVVLVAVGIAAIALATASAAYATRPVQRTAEFTLPAGPGFHVLVQAGSRSVFLAVTRRHQMAYYAVPGGVSRTGDVEARFGSRGRISVSFEPDRSVRNPCRNVTEGTEGFFVGAIHFRGERHYLDLDADRAKGNVDVPGVAPSCNPKSRESTAKSPRLASGFPGGHARSLAEEIEEEEEIAAAEIETANLTAQSPAGVGLTAIGSRRGREIESSFFEVKGERRGRMTVIRGASVFTRTTGAFEFDAQLQSATLRPPKLFHGEVALRREPDGTVAWTGSLSVPIFGGDRATLGAPDVAAKLVHKIPYDE